MKEIKNIDKKEPKCFNRDLSWLSFNYRVLEEAKNETLPIYERIKFLAIYSSNLDEFYKVRVASHRSVMDLSDRNKEKLKVKPKIILQKINKEVNRQLKEFSEIIWQKIVPELRQNNIIIYQNEKLTESQEKFLKEYFLLEILPYIQPSLLTKNEIFTFLQDNVNYLVVRLLRKRKKTKRKQKKYYAIIKIPAHHIPRFTALPKCDEKNIIIFLDDIIRKNMNMLFPAYQVDSSYSIKLSRDADLMIEDEFKGNLVEKIRKSLSKRKTGHPARFMYDGKMPQDFLKFLRSVFNLSKDDFISGEKYHCLSDFFNFPNPLKPSLELEPFVRLKHRELSIKNDLFEAIKEKDYMLHFPYQSYNHVIRFLNQAAFDPKVTEIKATQYRVASNSAVVSALISAARNGKKVTVFVEVKARFDEASNLNSMEQMKKAGIKVIASIPGIKVHSKVALVLRKSSTKKIRGYAFLSTGNFNEKTAKLYADHGFFTSDENIISELNELFLHLENRKHIFNFKHLLVAQFNMPQTVLKLIDREAENAEKGKKANLILKMNGLEDKKTIDRLYKAADKGVKINLLIRGICCIIPRINIRIIRIVDRFLEHARVWYFYNEGKDDMYISSADLMERNLYRRIETAIPIFNKEIKQEMLDILNIQLADNTSARYIDENLNNCHIEKNKEEQSVRSQVDIYNYLNKKLN